MLRVINLFMYVCMYVCMYLLIYCYWLSLFDVFCTKLFFDNKHVFFSLGLCKRTYLIAQAEWRGCIHSAVLLLQLLALFQSLIDNHGAIKSMYGQCKTYTIEKYLSVLTAQHRLAHRLETRTWP